MNATASARFDKHGDLPDSERLARALSSFVRDVGATAALHLESCVHCGLCAEACHFYVQTKDPKYTPVSKLEPLRQAYRREIGPFNFFAKLLGLARPLTLRELEEWEELLYDSCTLCGRCTLICPMGIDIPSLVELSRHAMYQAGLVPDRLYQITRHAEEKGTSQSATPEEFAEIAARIAREHGVTIPVDRERADVMVAISASQLEGHSASFAHTAKILEHVGASWTMRSHGFEATNFGMLSGHIELQKKFSLALIDQAIACGAQVLLLPECGHGYGALRWRGAEWYGRALPFEVLHMSEFLGRKVQSGELRLKRTEGVVTYHDPCQAGRRGGVFAEPRQVLSALGLELRELGTGQEYNWCCGGGGGVLANARAAPLRAEAFRLKMVQVEKTGAQKVISACHQCETTFERGIEHFHWDIPFENLVELVAANLAE